VRTYDGERKEKASLAQASYDCLGVDWCYTLEYFTNFGQR